MEKAIFEQDMPPKIERQSFLARFPTRGPSNALIVAGCCGLVLIGHFMVAKQNQRRRIVEAERKMAKLDLAELMQAEEDVRYVHRNRRYKEHFQAYQASQPADPSVDDLAGFIKTRWMPSQPPVRPASINRSGYDRGF